MKTTRLRVVWLGLGLLLCSSCSKSGETASLVVPDHMKVCFQCNGVGTMKCPEPGCKDGLVDCPGPCMKLSKGVWEHMEVAGHPPTDLWQKFFTAGGGYQAWNQNHVGQVVEMRDGKPVNIGNCPVCGGTGKVKCPVCKGTGEAVCSVCEGKKVVPESWTAFDNPRMKSRPSQFKLKDGRTIFGRAAMVMGSHITIRTETGDVEVESADIVSEVKSPAAR